MVAHSGAPLFCFLAGLDSANRTDAKVTKAGLVGPAFLCGTGSFGLVSIADPAFSKSTAELVLAAYDPPGWDSSQPSHSNQLTDRAAGSPSRSPDYITIARFSSSCCRTGNAHPAISTRPAASIAAFLETPYPRPIRNTCSSSAASWESIIPP